MAAGHRSSSATATDTQADTTDTGATSDAGARALAGVRLVGSVALLAVELLKPAVLGQRRNAAAAPGPAAGDILLGALLLASPWRRTVLGVRAAATVLDAIRSRRLPQAGVGTALSLAALLLKRLR